MNVSKTRTSERVEFISDVFVETGQVFLVLAQYYWVGWRRECVYGELSLFIINYCPGSS